QILNRSHARFSSFGMCSVVSRMAEVYQYVPELSKKLERPPVIAPLAPLAGVLAKCGGGSPNHRSVKNAVPPGNPFRKPGHLRSAEVIGHIANGEPESAMPQQVECVLIRELHQCFTDLRVRERRVGHQRLNIAV